MIPPTRDPEDCGSFSTEINGHKIKYRIFVSAGLTKPTMVLYLYIDDKLAINGYGDLHSQECCCAYIKMPEAEINAALDLMEKEPQSETDELGNIVKKTRRKLK